VSEILCFIREKNTTARIDKTRENNGIPNSGNDLSGEYISPH
jgi:hypothetical protein